MSDCKIETNNNTIFLISFWKMEYKTFLKYNREYIHITFYADKLIDKFRNGEHSFIRQNQISFDTKNIKSIKIRG